jgi:leader peptidase (prepilin peptidase)/N-methyltransferase
MEKLAIFFLGLCWGSFLNTCIYRISRNISLVHPPSYCPSCNTLLFPVELIPLWGFLILGGRCRSCAASIAWKYPAVELFMAVLATGLLSLERAVLLPVVLVISLGVIAALIDAELGIIPNSLTISYIVFGLLFSYLSPLTDIFGSILGALTGGGILLLLALLSGGGMGGGDIKYMTALGAWLGWKRVLLVIFWSFLLGGLGGICFLLLKIKRRRDKMAFAPFITAALFITLFLGEKIAYWYFMKF